MKLNEKIRLRMALRLKPILLASTLFAGILGIGITAPAQKFSDIQTQKSPLVLKAQGSFYVGGESVEQTQVELGSFGPAGHITVNQMYVRYMIPQNDRRTPMVMIHGMTLTGKTWETTPDGRMGWEEYFVRQGHPVYVPDQVGRGRSGFNQAVFNNTRTGAAPFGQLSWIWRISDENTWTNFRFGTQPGVPYPGAQFPIAALGEFSKQAVPDLSLSLAAPNQNYKALSDLAFEVKDAVLMSHSQSGAFPLEAAFINPAGIKAMVLVEPGVCPSYTEQQIEALAAVPILIVYGDHLGDVPTGIPGFSWQSSFDGCKTFTSRVNAAGGKARLLYMPDEGVRGNSHMIMQDKNNLQIADLITKWIDANVTKITKRNKEK